MPLCIPIPIPQSTPLPFPVPRHPRLPMPHAFSLVEILIVIGIMAMLVGGTYQIYFSSAADARFQMMQANRSLLRAAITQYRARHNRYPASLEVLTRSYMNRVPDDPTTLFEGNDWMVIGPGQDSTKTTNWVTATVQTPPGGIADVRSASDFQD